MQVKYCFSFWLMHLTLQAVVFEALRIHNYICIEDPRCDQYPQMERNLYAQETTQSKLDCARRCAHNEDCEYVRILSFTNGTNWCEVSLCNRSSEQLPLQPLQQSDTSLFGLTESCYKCVVETISGSQSPWPICKASGYLEQNTLPTITASEYNYTQKLAFIDSTNPETLTADHLVEFEDKYMDAKVVFRDENGVFYALVANYIRIVDNKFSFLTTYVMDKTVDGFSQTATRISYVMKPDEGEIHRAFVGQDETSWIDETMSPEMRVYIPRVSEYSLIADVNVKDVPTLISWVRQGFKAFDFTHATIWNHEDGASFYTLDQNPIMNINAEPKMPLWWKQVTEAAFMHKNKGWIAAGISSPLFRFSTSEPSDIAFSPLWRRAVEAPTPDDETLAVLNSLLLQAHRFRVSYDNSFFDVHDVIKVGNEMYFLLPQQVKGHPRELTDKSVGLRAVLTLRGYYSWCSHQFEGAVLDSGFESHQTFDYFVDKKTWRPLFSVFSNGTVAYGKVSDIADAALSGADVNVLIEWLTQDIVRLLSVIMVSVNDYKTPGVVVSAESFVTWNIDNISRKLSPQCYMAKLLLNSNGDFQALVFTTRRTETMYHVTDVKSTWFVV